MRLGTEVMIHSYQTTSQQYDIAAIRRLLPKILVDETFFLLCYDYFFPVYQHTPLELSLEEKARRLVAHCHEQQQLATLLPLIRDINPHQYLEYDPAFRQVARRHRQQIGRFVRFFVAYQASSKRDHQLVSYLYHFFTKLGHHLFVDRIWPKNQAGLTEIDQQLKRSDLMLALVSEQSVDSEMLRAEISQANEYRQAEERPEILLVRMAYDGLLPYSIDSRLSQAQTFLWQTPADHEQIASQILAFVERQQGIGPQNVLTAITTDRPSRPVKLVTSQTIIAEDGQPVVDERAIYPPLPEFDPRFLDELTAPGGAVKLRDRFYVERPGDQLLQRQLATDTGTTTTIRASRQMGKSSLLVRAMNYARQHQAKMVYIDLQGVDRQYLQTLDMFLRYLAELMVRKLRLNIKEVEQAWQSSLGAKEKLTYLMEDYILRASASPIVLALDEVDLLVQSEEAIHTDFFSLLRSWHNHRAYDFEGLWDKLYIIMAISTEPYLLIKDVHQSPFNVGLKIYLEDFDPTQVYELNWKHGAPIRSSEFGDFMRLLNGHPYLTRKALYTMVTEQLDWSELYRVADDDDGPFSDHLLRSYWLLLNDQQGLAEALRAVIRHNYYDDEIAILRLLKAGLIKGSGNHYSCRCDLYRRYFEDKLLT